MSGWGNVWGLVGCLLCTGFSNALLYQRLVSVPERILMEFFFFQWVMMTCTLYQCLRNVPFLPRLSIQFGGLLCECTDGINEPLFLLKRQNPDRNGGNCDWKDTSTAEVGWIWATTVKGIVHEPACLTLEKLHIFLCLVYLFCFLNSVI